MLNVSCEIEKHQLFFKGANYGKVEKEKGCIILGI